jgi:hypothetical protein
MRSPSQHQGWTNPRSAPGILSGGESDLPRPQGNLSLVPCLQVHRWALPQEPGPKPAAGTTRRQAGEILRKSCRLPRSMHRYAQPGTDPRSLTHSAYCSRM